LVKWNYFNAMIMMTVVH